MRAFFLLAMALSWQATLALAAASDNSFAVRNVRVFDGEKTIAKANVIVRDGMIIVVGTVPIPNSIKVIDGSNKTLLPGLIDSHVHVFPGAQADALRFGVTTELDMFDLAREFAKWRAQRQSLGQVSEADTWAAGIGVTVRGGHPLETAPGIPVPTLGAAQEAKAFVDARVAEGSDCVKLFTEDLSEYGGMQRLPTLSRDEVCAVVKAAHEDHKLAIVHISKQADARQAIECGADGLAHLFGDATDDQEFAAFARQRGVFFETTLDVIAGTSGLSLGRQLAADSRVAPYLSPAQKGSLIAIPPNPHPDWITNALAAARALHRAGVPVLAGTDSPNPATAHGVSLHEELALLVQAGFTPEEALHTATEVPDQIFKLGDRGRIAPGYRADLLLVDGDPTRAIGDTLSIVRIWKNGYAISRAVLTP